LSEEFVGKFRLGRALDRVDAQLDLLIYDAFPLPIAVEYLTLSEKNLLH